MTNCIISERSATGVATITLNRPDARNALNQQMIDQICIATQSAINDETVRVIVFKGAGSAFCAGGDLSMMKGVDKSSDNSRNSFSAMLRGIDLSSKPTVAIINGAAFGGGLGIVAACDIAVANEHAQFALSEVNLGLIPSVISPFVVRAMGARMARRFFLTGERFNAQTAHDIRLVHSVVPDGHFHETCDTITGHLLTSGPAAVAESKRLIRDVSGASMTDELFADLESRIADRIRSDEGQTGIAAFLAKTKPAWANDVD